MWTLYPTNNCNTLNDCNYGTIFTFSELPHLLYVLNHVELYSNGITYYFVKDLASQEKRIIRQGDDCVRNDFVRVVDSESNYLYDTPNSIVNYKFHYDEQY